MFKPINNIKKSILKIHFIINNKINIFLYYIIVFIRNKLIEIVLCEGVFLRVRFDVPMHRYF